MDLAFLGLGIMGSRMAANLIKAGHHLTVWNRTAEKAQSLTNLGAVQAATPAEAVRGKELVITMLANPQAVESAAFGPDGFLDALHPGALWMDSSTVNPSFTRRMVDEAARRKARFMDAPVSGTKGPAETGQLIFLVGGETKDLEQVRPLMDVMGKTVIHAGEAGMGSSLKMVFNMLLAQAMLAFSEALVLGEAMGLKRERLFEILQGSAVVAPAVNGKRAKIESNQYEADFPLQWMQKDLELAAVTGYENGVALPATNVAKEIYMLAARKGLAGEDFSAIYAFLKDEDKE